METETCKWVSKGNETLEYWKCETHNINTPYVIDTAYPCLEAKAQMVCVSENHEYGFWFSRHHNRTSYGPGEEGLCLQRLRDLGKL